MKRYIGIAALTLTAISAAYATSYLGSVVNSWNGRFEGSETFYPNSLAYGTGYIWLGFGTFITQRIASTGSLVDVIGFSGPGGDDLGYQITTKYLYFACGNEGVYCRESSTGSTVGSFGIPPGATCLSGIDVDNGNPTAPLWLGDRIAWRLWNVTPTGNVARSLKISFNNVGGVAYDGTTASGPFLFVGTKDEPPLIYAINPASGSIRYSFQTKVCPSGIGGLSWDGNYLWALDEMYFSPGRGIAYQIIAHEPNTELVPASLGRIRALYR